MMYLGIDPSTSKTGFAVVSDAGELVASGKIPMKADCPQAFKKLYADILHLVETYGIKYVGCENQYSGPDPSALIKLARTTGVVLAALGETDRGFEKDSDFIFFMPSQWRKLFQGQGKHTKKSTYLYVKEVLGVEVGSFTADNDRTDAIGIAYATRTYFEGRSE